MKLEALLITCCLVSTPVLISCDDDHPIDADSSIERFLPTGTGHRTANRKETANEVGGSTGTRADTPLDRADGMRRSRFESRIGLQPWPSDLPPGWPRPETARVVATTRQQGNRLLLVDLPGSPDDALLSYRIELEAQGYAVLRPDLDQGRFALRARLDDTEVVLTFFRRERHTRLEILFVVAAIVVPGAG